jgi:PKD repeat protein
VTDNGGATAVDSATVIIAPAANQAPHADANGPYSTQAGAPLTFSSTGSNDPDGSITQYSWSFGDGGSATGQFPSHTYASTGTFTVTLTVTDNQGATDSDQTTVTVVAAGNQPFTWSGAFAPGTGDTVTLTLTLDLSTDIPETSVPEALAEWAGSISWNTSVLTYASFRFLQGFGSFQWNGSTPGTVTVSAGRPLPANSAGVIQLAEIRFRVAGTGSTTTSTTLTRLQGTTATGSFDYRAFTAIQEATYPVP